jgi:hypothetical protein
MYSLVNAPALCYDLVRVPYGAAVAGTLRRALRLEPVDLPVLAAEYADDAERQAAWDELEAACHRSARVGGTPRRSGGPPGDAADPRGASPRLSAATLGGLADLVSLVRADVLDWTWQQAGDLRLQTAPRAVAVVTDGVAGCLAGTAVSPAAFTRLRLPWTTALRRIDSVRPYRETPDEFGPATPAVRLLAARLAAATPVDLAALDVALDDARRAGFAWASTMHGATWALEVAGRIRTAAAAQLAVVRALPITAHPPPGSVPGAVAAVMAAVQASVVADLLDSETYEALTRPWCAIFGPLP